MGKQRSSFAKLQRDRAKAAKRAAKQASRQNKGVDPYGPIETVEEEETAEDAPVSALFEGKGELSAPELLEMIEEVHKKREAGLISQEEFEDAKVEIFARLPVD